MALETGTYISDLVATNPTFSDPVSAGDDHIRLLKSTIKATFPNISGAVTATHTELNYVDGVTSNIQSQLDGKQATGNYLTTATTFGGDVSGTYNAIVVANDSHTHSDSTIDSLNASAITAGTMATARLGSGTASSSTFLRGDSTWQTISVDYAAGNAALPFGSKGTYGFFITTGSLTNCPVGSTTSGSNLKYGTTTSLTGGLYVDTNQGWYTYAEVGPTSPAGTWKNMGIGYADSSGSYHSINLWLRTV